MREPKLQLQDAGVGNQIQTHVHQYGTCSIDSQDSCDDSCGLELSDSDCDSPCHEPLTQTVCSSASGIITMMSSGNDPLTNFNLNFGSPVDIQSHIITSIPLFTMGSGSTGTVFHLNFLGSVEVDEECGRKKRKRLKKNMVEEAVTKIKVCYRKQHRSAFKLKFIFLFCVFYYLKNMNLTTNLSLLMLSDVIAGFGKWYIRIEFELKPLLNHN